MTPDEKRIVEWLREQSSNWSEMKEGLVAAAMSGAADAIERGEHRK